MNWYAMMLDGQMKQREIIREAELRRQTAMARGRGSSTEPPRSRSLPPSRRTGVGALQLFWQRLVGSAVR